MYSKPTNFASSVESKAYLRESALVTTFSLPCLYRMTLEFTIDTLLYSTLFPAVHFRHVEIRRFTLCSGRILHGLCELSFNKIFHIGQWHKQKLA